MTYTCILLECDGTLDELLIQKLCSCGAIRAHNPKFHQIGPSPCSVPQPQEKGADRHQQSSSEALVSALEPLPSQSGAARLLRNIQTVLCSAEDFTMELHFFIFIFPNPHFQRLSFQRVY